MHSVSLFFLLLPSPSSSFFILRAREKSSTNVNESSDSHEQKFLSFRHGHEVRRTDFPTVVNQDRSMTFFHRTRPSLLHPPFFHTRGFPFFFLFHNPLISSFFFSFLLYICLGGILPSRFLKTFEPEFEAIRGHLAHPPKVHSYSAAAAVSVLSTVLSVFSTSR